MVDTRRCLEDALRPRLRAVRGLTYAGIGRWMVCVALAVGLSAGLALSGENSWSGALGGWAGGLALISIPPVLAAVSSAPRMSLAVYLTNGLSSVLSIALVLPFVWADIHEPWFSKPVAAAIYGAAMSLTVGLGAAPIILWGRLRAKSHPHAP